MSVVKSDLEELTQEVRKVIEENRKFLARIMEDDFEPDLAAEQLTVADEV
jgi:hypothetical protein